MSDTLAKVTTIVSSHLNVGADEVKLESRLIDDLGADSLDQVELVMAFEEEFNIEVSDDDAEKLQTVGDVVKHVDKLIAA